MLTSTPSPPYYAVIFTSVRQDDDPAYETMAEKMALLAKAQPGFLGMDSARQDIGITVSYWRNEAAIKAWKQHTDHLAAQQMGRKRWYRDYQIRVARVGRAYSLQDRPDMLFDGR